MWKIVIGYQDYLINEKGDVYSSKSRMILNQYTSKSGTKFVRLNCEDDKKKYDTCYIHRLVAQHFIPNTDKLLNSVRHIDGNKANNHVDNLEWVHRRITNNNSKLTMEDVRYIRENCLIYSKEFSIRAMSLKFDVSTSSIHKILRNEIYKEE